MTRKPDKWINLVFVRKSSSSELILTNGVKTKNVSLINTRLLCQCKRNLFRVVWHKFFLRHFTLLDIYIIISSFYETNNSFRRLNSIIHSKEFSEIMCTINEKYKYYSQVAKFYNLYLFI